MRSRISRPLQWKNLVMNQTSWGQTHAGLFNQMFARASHIRAVPPTSYEHYAAVYIREFIKHNHTIPNLYRKIETHPEVYDQPIKAIMASINENTFTAKQFREITQHPDCLQLILYLIENEKIPYWPGITLYQYMIAAAQFTNALELNPRDNDVKSIRKIKILPMVENGQLNKIGNEYLKQVAHELKNKMNFELDIEDATKFILSSAKIEQHLLKISFSLADRFEDPVEDMLAVLKMNVPLFQDESVGYCSFPPTTFMNYIFAKMSPEPIQARPILGNISEATRDAMRHAHQHPIALYSDAIKSNIFLVHRRRCGGFPALMHDWAHTYWANAISCEDRDMLLHRMIPALKSTQAKYAGTNIAVAIEAICHGLLDFDLSGSFNYENESVRFHNYVMRVIGDQLGKNIPGTLPEEDSIIIFSLRKFIAEEIAANRTSNFLKLFCHSMDKQAKMAARFPTHKIYLRMSRAYTPDQEDSTCHFSIDQQTTAQSVRSRQ